MLPCMKPLPYRLCTSTGSRDSDITFGGEKTLNLTGYSDSNWAGDNADRKSASGFILCSTEAL